VADRNLDISGMSPQNRPMTASPDEIKALAKDIHDRGLQHPIVVLTNGVVVDGLKRIEAFKHLKVAQIPAVVTDDLPEMEPVVVAARENEPLPVNRTLEMLDDLVEVRAQLNQQRKVESGRRRHIKKGVKFEPRPTIRAMLVNMTGMSQGRMEIATHIVKRYSVDPEVALKLQQIKDGKETLNGYQAWYLRRNEEFQRPVYPVDEVRTVMERGTRTLATTIEAMGKFGTANVLTLSERTQLVDVIRARASSLFSLARMIRNGITQEREATDE